MPNQKAQYRDHNSLIADVTGFPPQQQSVLHPTTVLRSKESPWGWAGAIQWDIHDNHS